MRIAADDSRFGVPAAKLGLGYRFAGIKPPGRRSWGRSSPPRFSSPARQFTAQEALQMGLVNRVLPVAELENVRARLRGDARRQRAAHHRRGEARA